MILFDPREPVSAWSHGAGMLLAIPAAWALCRRCLARTGVAGGGPPGAIADQSAERERAFARSKAVTLLIFGLSLAICYGNSALYHAVRLGGEPLGRYRRLDHVGIYLLIAGSYTPVAWSLLRGAWRPGTLAVVWCLCLSCAVRVWIGGVLNPWLSTLIYLGLGWAALICYRVLSRTFPQRRIFLLPLGGAFYSVGAVLNLARWPALAPGVFEAHELFHFFVIAGSACHVLFMFREVVPAAPPPLEQEPEASIFPGMDLSGVAARLGWRLSARRGLDLVRRPHLAARRASLSAPEAGPSAVDRGPIMHPAEP